MESVIFNNVLRFDSGPLNGFYRVIVASRREDEVLLYKLADLKQDKSNTFYCPTPEEGATKKLVSRERSKFHWVKWSDIEALAPTEVKIHQAPGTPKADAPLSKRQTAYFEIRAKVMKSFLDQAVLQKAWLRRGRGFAILIRKTVIQHEVSAQRVYEWWHLLCNGGFVLDSLRPKVHKCGAPGVRRMWGAGSVRKTRRKGESGANSPRKKPGRFTDKERDRFGRKGNRDQPKGWTDAEERLLISAYDTHPSKEKKSFAQMYPDLIKTAFAKEYVEDAGVLVPIAPPIGAFPDVRAAKRIVNNHFGMLRMARNQTTVAHFMVNLRGSVGRSYKGVPGPGHRYGIDATRGDMYLRSSINRSWIVGRPIVYLVVDVWSTAVVGFYCCLEGPSWVTAQVALYSSICDPKIVADVWGIRYAPTLFPAPTTPWELVVDRGELLCKRAENAAQRIGWAHKVMPAYRPELKGWLEVLHRIIKDQFYAFVPGALNARRKEYELQSGYDKESILVLRAYAALLALEIERYNLCADRSMRVTQDMLKMGVFPSPAGLWSFGHAVGLGYRKHVGHQILLEELLPRIDLHATRQGVYLGPLEYTGQKSPIWAEQARNFHTMTLGAHYHPGSIAKIWVPEATGIHELELSPQAIAKRESTFEETADFRKARGFEKASQDYDRTAERMKLDAHREAIIEKEKALTLEADQSAGKDAPSVREAREIERQVSHGILPASVAAASTLELPEQDYENSGQSRYELMLQESLIEATAMGEAQ